MKMKEFKNFLCFIYAYQYGAAWIEPLMSINQNVRMVSLKTRTEILINEIDVQKKIKFGTF